MSADRVVIEIHCTDEELKEEVAVAEHQIRHAEGRAQEMKIKLNQLEQETRRQEGLIIQQYQNLHGLITAGFSMYRNFLRFFGATLTSMEQVVLGAIEATMHAVTTMAQAIQLAQAPGAGFMSGTFAFAVVQVSLSLSATAMMVAAEAKARSDFRDIHSRVRAMDNMLDIGSRYF